MAFDGQGRSTCYRCFRPAAICICRGVTPVENRTGVWILQHPRERFHPIGTARIATCGLTNVHSVTAFRGLTDWPDVPPDAALLFPSPDATELGALPPCDRPRNLLVVDGTWANAAVLLRDQPWLGRFRRYRIEPTKPGNYRIRKAPAPRCLSTIEAIVQALLVLEPETEGLAGLVASFDSMIDRQIEMAEACRAETPRRGRRDAPPSFLPRAITGPEGLVLVHGESISTSIARSGEGPRREGVLAHHRELLQWAAVRVSTGALFDGLVKPEVRFPSEAHLRHMGIEATDLRAGLDMESIRCRWQTFVRPGDVIATMHQNVIDVGAAWLGSFGTAVALKTAHANWRKHSRGGADRAGSHPAPAPPPPPRLDVRGRAGAHLAQTFAWLQPLLRSSAEKNRIP